MSSLLQLSVKSLHHSQSSPTLEKWHRPKCLPICLKFIRVLNVYRLWYKYDVVSLIFMKASCWLLSELPLSRPKPPKNSWSEDPPGLLCCRWLPIISDGTSLPMPHGWMAGILQKVAGNPFPSKKGPLGVVYKEYSFRSDFIPYQGKHRQNFS